MCLLSPSCSLNIHITVIKFGANYNNVGDYTASNILGSSPEKLPNRGRIAHSANSAVCPGFGTPNNENS